MNKAAKISLKVIGSILAVIVGLVLMLFVVMTIGAHIKYHEFYSLTKPIARNPGLLDDYVPQGITYNDDENYIATCGYMKDHTDSRIYTVTGKKKIKMYTLTSEGKPFTGHTGGLQYAKGNFYLASEGEGVYIFSADFDKNASSIEIGKVNKVNNNSSFCFSDDENLYVGEFAHVPNYPCVHDVELNGQKHTAIMSQYKLNNLSKPVAVYAIPDEVQGVGVSKNGSMIVSRSWGITFASYDVYTKERIVNTGKTFDGAPLFFFTEPSKVINSIYFTEDIDVVDGKIITMTEAAANKYNIGKFIFDTSVYQLNFADVE